MYSIGILLCLLASFPVYAQDDPCSYTEPLPDSIAAKDEASIILTQLYRHELSLLAARNKQGTDAQGGYLFSLSSLLQFETMRDQKHRNYSLVIFDETGWLFIADSLSVKTKDLCRVKIGFTSGKENMGWSSSAIVSIESQKLPGYRYTTAGSSQSKRTKESTFMSPVILLLSIGLAKKTVEASSFDLGIGACKFTWVASKALYELNNQSDLAVLKQAQRLKVEGGLSFRAVIDKNLGHNLNWSNNTILFSDITKLNGADLEFRNNISWTPARLFRTSLQTIIVCNKAQSPSCSWKGEVTVGLLLDGRRSKAVKEEPGT